MKVNETVDIALKQCTKCKEFKPVTDFYKKSKAKDGLTYRCKSCLAVQSHEYHQRNKDICRDRLNSWREQNREYVRERDKEYRKTRPDIEFAKQKRYRDTHKDKLYIKGKNYRENNREYFRAKYKERADTVKNTSDGSVTQEFCNQLLEAQHYKCAYCGCDLTDKNRNIDHIIPLSRGGTHTADNIHFVCVDCNMSKGNKLESEWIYRPYLHQKENKT